MRDHRMALNRAIFLAILVVTAVELIGDAAAATYVVGDSLGWTVPPGGAATYAAYASQHVFTVGDVLVFNFTTGAHDVAKVSKAAFDSCSSTNPIILDTLGPASITLDSSGEAYFTCTFGQHCSFGQKLAINVTANSTSPTPSAPPTPPTITPSPPPMTQTPPPAPSPGGTTTPPPMGSTPAPPPGGTATPPPMGSTPSPSPGGTATPPMGPTPSPSPGGTVTPPSGSTPAPSPGGTASPPPPESSPSPTNEGLSPPPPPNSAPVTTIGVPVVILASVAFGLMI